MIFPNYHIWTKGQKYNKNKQGNKPTLIKYIAKIAKIYIFFYLKVTNF